VNAPPTLPRPVAVTGPFAVVAAMTLAIHVISRTTGSGWLVAVVAALLAVLVLSAVLPALALVDIDIVVRAPTDATAGRPVTITLKARGRGRGVKLRLLGPASGWVRIDGPGSGALRAVAPRRGVLDHIELEVRSGAPFGLLWWRRRLQVPLEHPLAVGPDPQDAPAPYLAAELGPARPGARASHPSPELVRGLRDYVPGDPPRLVSWRATARHGRLMVKELEARAAAPAVVLVVDLRGDDNAAEEAASRAAGVAIAALRQGIEVTMGTMERDGPRLGGVASALEVSRRLARATGDGPPATAPSLSAVGVVRVVAQ